MPAPAAATLESMPDIRDIAKKAGVSVATVSRALRRPEVVAPETRARVEAAIAEIGYRPNAMASGLRRQRSNNIVVVVPYINNPFFAHVIQGIENVAHANGHKVLLGESQNSLVRLDSYARMQTSKEAEGLILLGALLPTVVREAMIRGEPPPLPLVMACEYVAGLAAPDVRIDNVEAAALATEHLVALGHRRIAHISGPPQNPLSRDRLKGFKARIGRAGLKLPAAFVARGDFSAASGYAAMRGLLALSARPTAVFCANDEMAMGAIHAAREAKLSVPGDVSLVGFDNIHFSEYVEPPLTTIAQPRLEIGETAMRLMLDVFSGRKTPATVVLPHSLVVRGSTRRLK
jgi:LacI family transcriptional regulator, repressor for deo operon, udp, cdd, tsx, nupC, and nupG